MYKLFLSLRYLRSHRIIYFSIAGVAMGIFVMIIVTSVMGGFSRDLRQRIRGMQSDLVVVQAVPDVFLDDYETLCAEIEKIPGVRGCAPRVEWEAWIVYRGSYKTVHFVGIDTKREQGLSKLQEYFREGTTREFAFPKPSGPNKIPVVLGTEFPAITDGTLTTFRKDVGVFRRELEIHGLFRSGMAEYDHNYIFMSLENAQDFLRLPGKVTTLSITLQDFEKDGVRVRQAVMDTLHTYVRAKGWNCTGTPHTYGRCSRYQTQTWEEAKSILLQAVSVEKGIQIIILFFIVIVAGFNIIAIYTLVVRSKTRDIGILRALGATKGGVTVVFLLSGMFCGLMGSVIGIGGGLAAAAHLNEVAEFVEVASREFNQIPRSTALLSLALLLFACGAGLLSWITLYWRPWPHSRWFALATSALVGTGVWYFLSWLAPHENCYWNWPEESLQSTRLWVSLGAAGVPLVLALVREWLRRGRSDALWSLFTLGSTFVYAGLAIAVLGVTILASAVVALQPPERWRGLELFPKDVYYLDRIPVYVDTNAIAMIVVLTLVVSLIFSIYPALKAASYDPIEAIRDE